MKRQLGTSVEVPVRMLRSDLRNAHTTTEGDISQQNNQKSDGEHASMDESDIEANKDALGEPTSGDQSDLTQLHVYVLAMTCGCIFIVHVYVQ